MKRSTTEISGSPVEELHNYYEFEVLAALQARNLGLDADTFVDLMALTLNRLPARYIRHKVDMVYFTNPNELTAMKQRVERAIDEALANLAPREPEA